MANHKILAIVGPTAVGKTAFAIQVADWVLATFPEYTGVDFFSADSRQVYQGLEIISGADLPAPDSKKSWFGIGTIQPNQDWSVAHFQRLIQSQLPQTWAENRLPIIVGGTGLYVNQALETDTQLHVPPNQAIRDKAEVLDLEELQAWTTQVAPERWANLNDSDRSNPRRLIRVIEIATFQPENREKIDQSIISRENMLTIGLQDEFSAIEVRIKKRVEERWKNGALAEIEKLITAFPDQKLPIFSATGVKPLLAFLTDQISPSEAQALWFRQERQYAKRQLTWWKKQTDVEWFAINEPNWQSTAQAKIASWLSE